MADIQSTAPSPPPAPRSELFRRRTGSFPVLSPQQQQRSAKKQQQQQQQHPHHHRVHSAGARVVALGRKRGSRSAVAAAAAAQGSQIDDEDMASSFLQFCPICDMQQAAPRVANLYCSDGCRQKDSSTSCSDPASRPAQNPSDTDPLPLNLLRSSSYSLPSSHTMALPDFAAMTTRVVPEQAPSTLASLDVSTPARSLRAFSDRNSTPSPRSSGRRRQPSADDIRSTAAMNFLAQFHNSPQSMFAVRSRRSSSQLGLADRVRAPSLALSNGSTPTESDPGSPGSLKRLASGSEGSLNSLAPIIQSPGAADISESEALEMGKPPKAARGRTMNRTAPEAAAKKSLKKMLAGSNAANHAF